MPHFTASSGDGCPSEHVLLEEVARHPQGIDAVSLADIFLKQGHHAYDVQRAMQRALDKGVLELGPKLRLYASRSETAAA
jgi:hypothetical protein